MRELRGLLWRAPVGPSCTYDALVGDSQAPRRWRRRRTGSVGGLLAVSMWWVAWPEIPISQEAQRAPFPTILLMSPRKRRASSSSTQLVERSGVSNRHVGIRVAEDLTVRVGRPIAAPLIGGGRSYSYVNPRRARWRPCSMGGGVRRRIATSRLDRRPDSGGFRE